MQAVPAGQHVRFTPVPQGVVPAGQPQNERLASTHATPLSQQLNPQGVVPLGQQHEFSRLEHVSPLLQHAWPHGTEVLSQKKKPLASLAPNTAAPTAAAAAPPISFRAPRRDFDSERPRDRASKRSLMGMVYQSTTSL